MKEKSNRVYKLAAVLMILCLITACVIGTTLAKYTTSGSGSDTAQVAKWGVKIEIQGDTLFSNQYTGTDSAVTVKASDTFHKVVAAGTQGGGGSMKFAISGKPEVAVNVKIDFVVSNNVVLKAGTYDDETTASNTTDTFTLSEDYSPIKFVLKQTKDENGDKLVGGVTPVIAQGSIKDIETALAGWSHNYAPNTNLAAEFELSWTWDFNGNDKADTFLGNRAADETTNDNWSTSIGYTLTVTATQIG